MRIPDGGRRDKTRPGKGGRRSMRNVAALIVLLMLAGCGGGSSDSATAQVDLPLDDVNWTQIIDDVKPTE